MSTPRNKPLIFIVAFLILTNIAVLGYFLWYKKGPQPTRQQSRTPGIEMELKTEVGFNDDQLAKYKEMRDEQWKVFKPMFEDVRKAKDSLFRMLGDKSANDSLIERVAMNIGDKQTAMDLQAFNHFRRVRTLCTADQLQKYDSLIPRLIRKMGGGKHGDGNHKDKKQSS